MRPYNIEVSDDVVIGIELVEVYGKDINFAISAAKGLSFLRLISQDKWTRYSHIGMNFTLLTSFPVSATDNVSNSRELPKKITLYYDVSKHMKKRFSKQEFNLLSKYLLTLKEVEIEVIKFNNTRNNTRIFTILKGDASELITYLQNSDYDGASGFKNILKTNTFNADAILLFSSGIDNFSPLQSEVYIPTFCINSLTDANHLALQKTAFYADGHYINLSKISSNQGLDFMINEIEDNEIYTNVNDNETIEKDLLYGKVFYVAGSIQGATIRVKNTFIESQSDAFGYFKIKAKEDDILVVNYFGMEEKEVLVSNSKEIYILMKLIGELLDEVLLKGKTKKEEEVVTGFGKSSKDAIGYSLNTITSKDIKPHHTTLADVIRGNFAGVKTVGLDLNNPKFIMRGWSSIFKVSYVIFDIDGAIYTDNPPYINPQDIESITILKSLAATVKYGTVGNGGVIKIVTKFMTGGKGKRKINSALVKGNDYVENGILLIESVKETPSYLREFETAISYKNALTIYSKHLQQKTILSTPYYLDVSDYFKKWNKDKAYTILSNIASVAYNNPKALTTLAYKLEELEKFEQAKHIYKRIIELRPNDTQSYRDLALSYTTTGYYTEAMELYGKMLNNQIENVDFKGLEKVITSEFMHLLAKHRSKINFANIHADYLKADFKYDIRIVFEWNDPSTEFELQFVNPQKKFFKWSHTRFENKERLLDEIKNGYHIEEFIIDDYVSGEWIINIECLSKADELNPTYLKYTVYRNYGLANETKDIKVIKLDKQLQKVTLDMFLYK